MKPGSDLTLLAFDTLPSLTLIDACVLVFPEKSLGLGGPLTAGTSTNSTIRGPVSLGSASRNMVVSNDVELRLAGPISGINLSLNRPGLIKAGAGTLLLLSNNRLPAISRSTPDGSSQPSHSRWGRRRPKSSALSPAPPPWPRAASSCSAPCRSPTNC